MRRRKAIQILAVLTTLLLLAMPVAANVPVSGGVVISSPNGASATLTGSTTADLRDFTPDSNSVEWDTPAGSIVFSAPGDANGSVHYTDIGGTWTIVSDIHASNNDLTINPSDKTPVIVGGDIRDVEFRDASGVGIDDGVTDFHYGGNSGNAKVELSGVPSDTALIAVDANDGATLDSATSNSTGWVNFDSLDLSSHDVQIQSGTVNPTAPNISDASPTGTQSSQPSQLAINVGDDDFPNDSVTVTMTLNGNQVKQTIISQNQTVRYDLSKSSVDIGTNTWQVNTTDSYGLHDNGSFSWSSPTNLTVRNETNASQIITGQNITIRLYGQNQDTVVQRSDSDNDGEIDLTGLPETEMVAHIDSDDYYDRRLFIASIYEQDNIYLLNSTAYPNPIDVTFTYTDQTERFPPDVTALQIERAVDPDDDGDFDWQVVAGDYWGAAEEFPFTGEFRTRYRLRVRNTNTGDQRLVGSYLPVADGEEEITVGQLTWPVDTGSGRIFVADLNHQDQRIEVLYDDPTNETTDLRIQIYERGNRSNEIHDSTFAGPYGTFEGNFGLTSNQTEQTWVVEYSALHSEEGSVSGQTVVGASGVSIPLDPWLLGTLGWVMITFIATLYGPRTALMGSWALVGITGVIMLLQLFTIPSYSIFTATLVALAGTVYREAIP